MDSERGLRLLVVPGVSPGRWLTTWRERYRVPLELRHAPAAAQAELLTTGEADIGFVRLPLDGEFHVIPLWTETTVLVLPRDHELAVEDELTADDLVGETILVPADDVVRWADCPAVPFSGIAPRTTADAVELVAAGAGVLALPASLARLHRRRDVTTVPLGGVPASQIGLAWRVTSTNEAVEDFVGVVRGRTANSSRGRPSPDAATAPADRTAAGRGRARRAPGSSGRHPGSGRARSRRTRRRGR